MFKFKGISSNDMQVIIEEEEHFIARASQRYEMTEIEGRDGAIFDTLGYSVVERPIYVQCLNIDKIDDILSWLNGEGEFEYKGRKTIARFYSQLEPQRSACIRIIDTTFIRDPFWSKSDDEFEIVKNRKDKNITGESIDLNDSAEYKFKKFGISGNSKQETRSGKNKLKPNILTEQTNNGITFTPVFNSNGDLLYININGTATSNSVLNISEDVNLLKPNTSYIISGITDGNTSICRLQININNKSFGMVSTSEIKFTTPDVINKIQVYIVVLNGYTINNLICKPMIRLASITDDAYEPYGAMPSPEFPSEIRNCGYNVNLFYLQNENVPNQTWFSIDENQLLKIKQGTGVAPTPIPIDIDLNVGDTVTISAYCVSGKYTTGVISVGLYHNGSDKAWEGQVTLPKGISLKNKTYTTTITVTNTVDTFMPFIYGNPSIEEDIKFYFKVEQGSKASPYSPYNCSNVNITVCNENFLDTSDFEIVGSELDIKRNENGSFTVNGTSTGNTIIKFKKKIKMNGSYTLIEAGEKAPVSVYTTLYKNIDLSDAIAFIDSHSTARYANFEINTVSLSQKILFSPGTYSNYVIKPMLIEGTFNLSNIGDYIEHQSQTITFPLAEGQKLMQGDYLAENGIHHKRKQVVLDGSDDEGWTINQELDEYISFYSGEEPYKLITPDKFCYCSHFGTMYVWSVVSSLNAEYLWNHSKTSMGIKIKKSRLTSINVVGFKAWLSENPIKIEYELDEEEIEPYTTEQQEVYDKIKELCSYKNITHIYSTDEISPVFEVTYIKETNEKILNAGNIQSRPILKLEKTISDSVELTINNVRFKYNFNGEKYVEIDCEEKTIKYENLNRSRQIEIGYEFPKLEIGNNNIIMHTGDCIIQAKRKDRWL